MPGCMDFFKVYQAMQAAMQDKVDPSKPYEEAHLRVGLLLEMARLEGEILKARLDPNNPSSCHQQWTATLLRL